MSVGGVYGSMLNMFPELFVRVPYFQMDAQTNGGYGERYNVVYVMVAPQNYGSHVLTVNGNLIRTNNKLFWSESVLQSGYFIEFDGAVYRFSRDNEWIREGGFFGMVAEQMVGDNGSNTTGTPVNFGESSFS